MVVETAIAAAILVDFVDFGRKNHRSGLELANIE